MASVKFRLDRSRGDISNQVRLLNIPLEGVKMSDVQTFVDKVENVMGQIEPALRPSDEYLCTWAYEKFKSWNQISRHIDKIKDSRLSSSKRTFKWLWSRIVNTLVDHREDANQAAIAKSLFLPLRQGQG